MGAWQIATIHYESFFRKEETEEKCEHYENVMLSVLKRTLKYNPDKMQSSSSVVAYLLF